VLVMDHPDGDLRWDHVPELHAEIVSAIRQFRPDAVVTFGSDGLYWHLDHVGVHERTFTAVRSLGIDAPALYFVTMLKGIMREIMNAAQARGGAPPESGIWGITPDVFGLSAEPPTLSIDVRRWVPRKLAALRCHQTQMASPNNPIARIDEEDARRWLGFEYFRRADETGTDSTVVLEQLGERYATRDA